ncbi:hypothetical protein HII31_03834 [Pseudocercospora fuligena]|uniref:2EXR domain-containing protein n=1 Tax=Pseudocercospora fuligena TaxID=685502 RepID=A0A8H6RQ02_9PEZI|nr:hypothetical protein HII31_03834 [Pseudocercospora fuligena]
MEGPYETISLIDAAEREVVAEHGQSGNHPDEDLELELELYIRDYFVHLNGQHPYSYESSVRAAEIEGKQYFLEMPAELRNEIYRMVLPTQTVRWFDPSRPHKDPINVRREDRIRFSEPAVLQVNRQMREEAWSIYYKQNQFIFNMWAMDARTLVKWCQVSPRRSMANIVLSFDGRYVEMWTYARQWWWPALLFWLEQFYYGKCVGLSPRDTGYQFKTLDYAAAMFDYVRGLSEEEYWPCIRQKLERHYRSFCDLHYAIEGSRNPARTS